MSVIKAAARAQSGLRYVGLITVEVCCAGVVNGGHYVDIIDGYWVRVVVNSTRANQHLDKEKSWYGQKRIDRFKPMGRYREARNVRGFPAASAAIETWNFRGRSTGE